MNELWRLDMTSSQLSASHRQVETPVPITSHECTVMGNRLVVFGGKTASGDSNKLYTYNMDTNLWNTIQDKSVPPAPRKGHDIIAIRDQIFVFGGETATGITNELWRFNFLTSKWSLVDAVNPPARFAHVLDGMKFIFVYSSKGMTRISSCLVGETKFPH